MQASKSLNLAKIALFSAFIAVCSWVTIPLGAFPVTLQSFAIWLCLRTLGGAKGSLSVLVYILLGACGLPVFSGFGAGLGAVFGPTGGFIFGFLPFTLLYWLFERYKGCFWKMILCLAVLYACGLAWYALNFGNLKGMLLSTAICILPDILKLFTAEKLSQRLGKIQIFKNK